MKTGIVIILFWFSAFTCKAQDLSGEWYIVDYQNQDEEVYSEIFWEFNSEGKCIWKLVGDNSVIFEFSYSISHTTCDDGVNDTDLHLKLVNLDDGEKLCYVFYGITDDHGRITMSVNEYGKAEPILFLKKDD